MITPTTQPVVVKEPKRPERIRQLPKINVDNSIGAIYARSVPVAGSAFRKPLSKADAKR